MHSFDFYTHGVPLPLSGLHSRQDDKSHWGSKKSKGQNSTGITVLKLVVNKAITRGTDVMHKKRHKHDVMLRDRVMQRHNWQFDESMN